jgi:hypothetical protein
MTTEQLLARMLKFAGGLSASCQYRGKNPFLCSEMQQENELGLPKAMPKLNWTIVSTKIYRS